MLTRQNLTTRPTENALMRLTLYGFLGLVLFWLTQDVAWAQTAPPANVDAGDTNLGGIQDRFEAVTGLWQTAIKVFAQRLFYALMTIDLFWLFIKIVTQNADLTKITSELVKRVMVYGLFIWLIQNNGFVPEIIQSFTQMAESLIGTTSGTSGSYGSITPANTFATGLNIAAKMNFTVGRFNFVTALFLLLSSGLVVIIFAIIAARLLVVLIETYFIGVIGVFMLAFGGLEHTRDLSKKFIFYAISAGVKLFLMIMIVGVTRQIILDLTGSWLWTSTYEAYLMTGIAVVALVLVNKVPELAGSIINGVSSGSGSGLGGIVTGTVGAAAGMAAGGAGLAMKASGAAGAASAGQGGTVGGAMKAMGAIGMGLPPPAGGGGGAGGGGEAPTPPPPPEN